jgi:transcriptional regulator with XRE-family HTH domain
MTFGTKLKYYRERKNFKQEYIAHKLGMTQPNYSLIENDKQQPSINQLQKLAQLLEVSTDILLSPNSVIEESSVLESGISHQLLLLKDEIIKTKQELIEAKNVVIENQQRIIQDLEQKLTLLQESYSSPTYSA